MSYKHYYLLYLLFTERKNYLKKYYDNLLLIPQNFF